MSGDPNPELARKLTLRRRVLTLTVAAVLTALFAWRTLLPDTMICYAVSYGGEPMGQVTTREEAAAAIREADAVAGELLGEENVISGDVVVTTSLRNDPESTEELAGMLLRSVSGIKMSYAITVDGVPVGTLPTEAELESLISTLLARFSTPNTLSAEFDRDVKIEYIYVSEELEHDPEALLALLSPDSELGLSVVTRESRTAVESVPYTTTYNYDPEGFSDEETLLREGVDGERLALYTVKLVNGEAVSSELTDSEVTTEPVSELILKGTQPGSRTDSRGYFIWPTCGHISSYFGYRVTSVGNTNHKGIDIANSVGTDVFAADGGTVIFAASSGAYGNIIKLLHDDGTVTYYAHLSSILVEEGDRVAQGSLIAKMGRTGNVTGPHLHFEVRPNGGDPVDPMDYLDISALAER